MRYYPIFLDLKGRRVIVIGGGKVAERKTAALLKAGAEVKVVSPTLTPRLAAWARGRRIEALRRTYRRDDLNRATLAFAATDNSEVNRAVAEEGERKKVWVNVADRSASSHFIVPALLVKGDLTLAISTGGKSPALAKRFRDDLNQIVSFERALWVKRLARVKESLIQGKVNPVFRRAFLRYLADEDRRSSSQWKRSLHQALKQSGLKLSEQKGLVNLIKKVGMEFEAGRRLK